MAHFQTLFLAALSLLASTAAVTDECGIAAYWGQNSGEGRLIEACRSGNYKYISLSSLILNGPNPNNAVLDIFQCNESRQACRRLGDDITACRELGVKVLLSLTGGDPNDQGRWGIRMALFLIRNFLNPNSSIIGPFGGAVLDGFDFALTQGSDSLFVSNLAGSLKRNGAFLTASPECSQRTSPPMNSAIESGEFNHIWVRFYNDQSCDYTGDLQGVENVVNSWNTWRQATSNTQSLVFLTFPASPEAASSGFVPRDTMAYEILPRINWLPRYGGVALWNVYYDSQTQYSTQIKGPVCAYTSPLNPLPLKQKL